MLNMVFSRYYTVLRCCGIKNSVKSVSSSSALSPISIISGSNNNIGGNETNLSKQKISSLEIMLRKNYCTVTVNKNEYESVNNSVLRNSVNSNDDDLDLDEYLNELNKNRPKVLDDCSTDLSHIAPELPMSFNFAAYADKSPTIQKLAELGVDFSKIEKREGIGEILLPLDFEKDMKLHIRFLNDCGVPPNELGKVLTKNPTIFKEDLDDLHTRIRYLRAHKFDKDMIARIVTQNPFWVMFSTRRIDTRLGFFQREFNLAGNEVRFLVTKQPRLITYSMNHVKENTFAVREEMGFDKYETKKILLGKPRIWMKRRQSIVECFDYVHNEMKLSHALISEQPEILTSKLNRIKQRHMFLVTQKRSQYDPTQPLYVSLKSLVSKTDAEFCTNVAKTPVETYNMFLKSL